MAKKFEKEHKHSLGDGLQSSIRKSASHEPLQVDVATSSESSSVADSDGFATSDLGSDTHKSRRHQRQTASDEGTSKPANSSAFLVGSSEEDDVFTQVSTDPPALSSTPIRKQEVQVYDTRTGKLDAQGLYPGTACMFVANLSQPYDDERLEHEVTKAFSQFGDVWVKIKRDGHQMPFAFCQFTKDEHARNAEKFGKGMMILGRSCRTEMARAHSSFVVAKKSGEPTEFDEAEKLLGQLGEVARVEHLPEDVQVAHGVSQAVLVTYKMYDNKRDPVRYFAHDRNFHVMPNDPKRLTGSKGFGSPGTKWNGRHEQMDNYDKDRRSAFVGNLPLSMTPESLENMAAGCGEVVKVNLYKKAIPSMPGEVNCFGFVEFKRPDSADQLVARMNDFFIEGCCIRVERKRSRTFYTPQRDPLGPLRHARSTIPRRRVSGVFMNGDWREFDVPSSPTGNVRDLTSTTTCAFGSYAQRRPRRPRSTMFHPGTSIGAFQASQQVIASENLPAIASANQRPTEFGGEASVPTSTPQTEVAPTDALTSPTTPEYQVQGEVVSGMPMAPSDGGATMPQMAWMPAYTPYGAPYGYSFAAPMTPQGAPAVMYPGYVGPHYYGQMVDIFGNMVISPTPVMSPYTGGHAQANTGSPRDANATGSDDETCQIDDEQTSDKASA